METYSIIVRAFILCVELNFFECTEIHSNIVNMLFKKKINYKGLISYDLVYLTTQEIIRMTNKNII
jgi:hypothetical protein